MSALDLGVYQSILRVRQAYGFDLGGLLMRFYYYMANIGVVTMLTLSGYSFFMAGLVSSTIALAVFLISPRIAKLIDQHGQSAVLPWAAILPVAGTLAMLACVTAHAPVGWMFPLAILMGCVPSPQALVRARWTYLVRTRAFGASTPSLHSVLSYEAVLDDIGFMLAPALSIFLASTLIPVAGLAFGIVAFVAGLTLITLSKATEPVPGWTAEGNEHKDAAPRENSLNRSGSAKSIFRTSTVVRVLFFIMFFLGAFFGALDTTTVSFAEELDNPNIASIALMGQSLASVVMGFVFGMVKLPFRQSTQLVLCAVLFGCAFACTAFVNSPFLLFAITIPAAFTYAPLLITVNATCEGAVPGNRFTEAITWVNAGATCGMTLGPTLAGAVVDSLGTMAAFRVGGAIVAMVALLALAFRRTLARQVH